ncbi:MAG: hypothetical protein EZS28_052940, partial [Streblomastix strix]
MDDLSEQSLRVNNNKQQVNSNFALSVPSEEITDQINQLVLLLKHDRISESEKISFLQQIITLEVNAIDSPDVARDSGVIEIVSSLLGSSLNARQLCGALISVVGQLGLGKYNEFDWIGVCAPLTIMLFSETLSKTGKTALVSLLEQNLESVHGLLQLNFMDRAAEILEKTF